MGDFVKQREYNISEFESIVPTHVEERSSSSTYYLDKDNTSSDDSINIDFSLKEFDNSFEDSGKFLGDFFRNKDVFLNEKWDVSENIQGKIVVVNEYNVHVDCLIDIESKTFQHRTFPINLFKNIDGLAQNKLVIIKTKMKAGAIRLDVYPGGGIVNDELFEQKENWDSLEGSGLDDKLTKW